MNNVMRLKALCKNLGAKTGTPAQVVLQNYLIERVLERIAVSRFNTRLVLKGGVLVSSMLGLDVRTTMDLDLTARRLSGTHEGLKAVFDEICAIDAGDGFSFSVSLLCEVDLDGVMCCGTALQAGLAGRARKPRTQFTSVDFLESVHSLRLLFERLDV